MKKLIIVGCVLAIIGILFAAEHYGDFKIVPNSDATEVFSVYNAARSTCVLKVDATNTQTVLSANGLDIRDTGIEIKSASDAQLGLYVDGTLLFDADTKVGTKIGTPSFYVTKIALDSGISGGGSGTYDSLLIVVDITNSTGGTADYDSLWLKLENAAK